MKFCTLATVRTSSSRLPDKCFLPLGKETILSHVIERAKLGNLNPIICTSTHSSDDQIEEFARTRKIPIYRGDLNNKIRRWAGFASQSNFNFIHLLDCDDPYFDTEEVHKSIETLIKNDLDLMHTSIRSDEGFASCGTSIKKTFLLELEKRIGVLKSEDLDVIPWNAILRKEDKIDRMPDNVLLSNTDKFRLTLDYIEDYWLITLIYQELGGNASRIEVEKFLQNYPTLASINYFRNNDFIANKKKKLETNFGVK